MGHEQLTWLERSTAIVHEGLERVVRLKDQVCITVTIKVCELRSVREMNGINKHLLHTEAPRTIIAVEDDHVTEDLVVRGYIKVAIAIDVDQAHRCQAFHVAADHAAMAHVPCAIVRLPGDLTQAPNKVCIAVHIHVRQTLFEG